MCIRDRGVFGMSGADTSDKAAPQELGSPYYLVEPYVPTEQQTNATVSQGYEYTFLNGKWIKQIRVWPAAVGNDYSYRLHFADTTDPDNIIYTTTELNNLAANQWNLAAIGNFIAEENTQLVVCLLYTSPSPRDGLLSRMPSSA